MSAPSITSQANVRAFAFDDQAQKHAAEGIGCHSVAAVRAHLPAKAQDLHRRADVMFRAGYQASGWTLRQMAWNAEGVR